MRKITELEYETLAMTKEANDKDRPITYPRMSEKLTMKGKRGISLYDALGLAQSLVERGLLKCDSKTVISPQGNLTLTRKGKRAYRKEYSYKNPKPIPKWKKVVKNIFGALISLLGLTISIAAILAGLFDVELKEWLKAMFQW